MPKLNGTGPLGYGAGTGRGFGLCCPRTGRGFNTGYGFKGHAKQDEKTIIQEDIKILKEELKVAEEELKSLKGQK
ncbi:MAG: DUF5320 domain-containing protein [bacterium]|nr:DUF5320 domain-containing protein [bacterium]